MANEENLIKPENLTSRELRERAQKGGKASVAARRRKKNMKQKLQALLELKPNAEAASVLSSLGIPEEEQDNEMLLVVSMFLAATEGRDTKAYDKLMDILGKTVQRKELAMKKKALAKQDKQAEENTSTLADTIAAAYQKRKEEGDA